MLTRAKVGVPYPSAGTTQSYRVYMHRISTHLEFYPILKTSPCIAVPYSGVHACTPLSVMRLSRAFFAASGWQQWRGGGYLMRRSCGCNEQARAEVTEVAGPVGTTCFVDHTSHMEHVDRRIGARARRHMDGRYDTREKRDRSRDERYSSVRVRMAPAPCKCL